MKKNKILILTPLLPYPLSLGGSQAQFHLIDRIRNQMEVTMLFPIQKGLNTENDLNALKELWPNVTFYPFYSKITDHRIETLIELIKVKIQSIFKIKPKFVDVLNIMSGDLYTNAFLTFVRQVVESDEYDIIQTEFYAYMALINSVESKAKKVFVQHEINFVRNKTNADLYTSLSVFEKYLLNRNKFIEIATMNLYDAVITLTEVDRVKLIESGVHVDVFTSPAGIASNHISEKKYQFNNKIVFLGPHAHFPNANGVEWFLTEIWERVIINNPTLEFHVIGNWPETAKKKYQNKNIIFHGFVSDLSEILEGSIFVVPLKIGSGMRMKIIEAVNYGCPIVTTAVGTEGLVFKNGRDCTIVDDAFDFADAIIDLSINVEKQHQYIQNSKETYRKKYSIKVLAEKRLSIYKSLIS